jgi:hypothetical protein
MSHEPRSWELDVDGASACAMSAAVIQVTARLSDSQPRRVHVCADGTRGEVNDLSRLRDEGEQQKWNKTSTL